MTNAINRQEVSTIADLNRAADRRLSSGDVAAALTKSIQMRLDANQIDRKLIADMRLALKCHPYDAHALGFYKVYADVFHRWSAGRLAPILDIINRCVAEQLPLPLIISCEKYLGTAASLRSAIGGRVFPFDPLIIRGDENVLEESYHDGILTLPVDDTYEGLPRKIFESFTLMQVLGARTGILKIDDDIKVLPSSRVDRNVLRKVFSMSDYIGDRIDRVYHDRTWHFGKCRDAVPAVYGKPYKNSWANGPLYYLSGRALNELALHYLRFPGCIDGELYEDKAIGDTLYQFGIHVHHCPLQYPLKLSMDAPERPLVQSRENSPTIAEADRSTGDVRLKPIGLVRSFDIFDTLIARRCLEPVGVFEMVEQRSGVADFAILRREAEERVASADYDLDAIYRELAAIARLSEAEAERLKQLEIGCELDQVIPIIENISQVRDGDILISDMYLDAATIRRLLAQAGFARQVDLIVSSAGKSSGRVWPEMLKRFAIEQHYGDNRQSDVAVPGRFGIAAKHADQSTLTAVESAFEQIGLRDLALLCREARLASWHKDPAIRALMEIQASLNLPLLLLASISLARFAKAQRARRLLFSSRDCNLWIELFPEVARRLGFDCEAEYFYTSRLARTRRSEDYLAYAASRLTRDSIVVDVCGTGWSLAHLTEHLGQSGRHNFFLRELPQIDAYEILAPTPARCSNHHVIGPDATDIGSTHLEMCNYSNEGMVLDVARRNEGFRPVYADDDRGSAVVMAIAEQRKCFLNAIASLKHHQLATTLALDDQAIAKISSTLYVMLHAQAPLFNMFLSSHAAEDQRVMGILMQPALETL